VGVFESVCCECSACHRHYILVLCTYVVCSHICMLCVCNAYDTYEKYVLYVVLEVFLRFIEFMAFKVRFFPTLET
jgi:hypothetical protein